MTRQRRNKILQLQLSLRQDASLEGCCIFRETEGETACRVQLAQTEIWNFIKRRLYYQTNNWGFAYYSIIKK
jgi:hypothetical protein